VKSNNSLPTETKFQAGVRVLLGLVFLFSSVVKGIDPVGTSYRVQDYLLAYGWTALVPYALAIAFLVIFSEFLLGLAFLFRVYIRVAAWGMLFMLLFFIVVTWLDARYNMVPDCGCFGDAVKLTNWQTFYKNIVLLLLNLLFLRSIRTKEKMKRNFLTQGGILILGGGLFLWFMLYNLNHLPVIDFRNWKTGRDMTLPKQKTETYVVYRNKKTGEEKEFLFPDYPWRDSAWMKQWTFVSQRTISSGGPKKYNLVIEDTLGNDSTRAVIEYPGFRILLVAYDLRHADTAGLKKAASLITFMKNHRLRPALLTATNADKAWKIEKHFGLNFPVFLADETDLKAMIRSNPGLILLHRGVVLKKWHYHDFPDTARLAEFLSRYQR
jgi:uncharacterized membrane protein YphA (DoxX/SURF4 family)